MNSKNAIVYILFLNIFFFQENIDSSVNPYPTTGLTGSSTIVYGAASKGIIKRDQQNNAIVYKTYYAAANPFQQVDQDDLEKYKKEVAQKQVRDQGKC